MSNVQVKNIPADVHDRLRARATDAGTTISDYVLELIRRDLLRPTRTQWITDVLAAPKLDLPRDEALPTLDQIRKERDDELWNRVT